MAKRKNGKTVYTDKDGKVIESCHCRRCQLDLSPRYFYEATDDVLDTNGYMSVCKDCIADLFMERFNIKGDLDATVLDMCRLLNVAYEPTIIDAVRTWIDNKVKDGNTYEKAFGFYKLKLGSHIRLVNPTQKKYFEEPAFGKVSLADSEDITEEEKKDIKYYEMTWGTGFDLDDYEFLEQQLANFKMTHKSDTYAEIVLLQQVCYTLLKIKKVREEGKGKEPVNELKTLQELMKNLNISPSSSGSSNKSNETLGKWIQDIEELEPAEWHENQELFKDMDGIGKYIDDFIKRPIRNFITASRDFTVSEVDGEVEIEYDNSEYEEDLESEL